MTTKQIADFASHHIEGFAHQGGGEFKVPLFSHIVGNLWVGGCPEGVLPTEFKYVVCLYPWNDYRIHDDTTFLQVKMYDDNGEPDAKLVTALAEILNSFCKAGQTLVHCQAGLNRSNLVAARALMLQGMSAQDAIKLLRDRRCDMVLCNKTFAQWLERQ